MSGILGQVSPSADTVLYKSPTDKYASCSLHVTNTNASTADNFDVAVRDYDKVVTLAEVQSNTSDFDNVSGMILSDMIIEVTTATGILDEDVAEGDTISFLLAGTSTPTGTTAKVAKIFEGYTLNEVILDQRSVDVIVVTMNGGFTIADFNLDDQLTDAGGDNGIVKGIRDDGGGNITLVMTMSSGNFTGSEVLSNSTTGESNIATVSSVTHTAAPALFNQDDNTLFNSQTYGDGTLVKYDLSDASITNGFDIFTNSGLSSLENNIVLRNGSVGNDGEFYFLVDSAADDTYYFGNAAYTGNLGNEIDTTGTPVLTGTDNALLLYDIQGGTSMPAINQDISLNSNTYTIQTSEGSSSVRTIGKWTESGQQLKVVEYDSTFFALAGNGNLLYNNSNNRLSLATSASLIASESYISKANSIAAASYEKLSGIILGPEQSVLVNCANGTTSFTLLGFEEAL